jgi:hypothetical protein
MDGTSVKVIWMRKDDIRHGYCHIVSAEHLGRQPRQQQQLVAWRHRSGASTIASIRHRIWRCAVRHPQPALRER